MYSNWFGSIWPRWWASCTMERTWGNQTTLGSCRPLKAVDLQFAFNKYALAIAVSRWRGSVSTIWDFAWQQFQMQRRKCLGWLMYGAPFWLGSSSSTSLRTSWMIHLREGRLSQPPPKLSTPKERKWRSVHQTICDEYEARLVGPSSRFIFHQLSVSRYQYQSMYTVLYMYVFQCCSPGNCIINHHTNYII